MSRIVVEHVDCPDWSKHPVPDDRNHIQARTSMRIHWALGSERRHGAAVVEFALVIPLLMYLVGIGVDWARAFYYHLTITNAARSGAIWACDSPYNAANTAQIQIEALRDCTSLGAGVTVTSSVYTVNMIDYVKVTVSYAFVTEMGIAGTSYKH